ncbi:tripartite tricarboxylate transporter substrate binding protein [Aquabacterium sp. J223]|uniref:Bug family tripartite tricarboxylate transporter substrate binding protein n=1 Tax=Aquabacterium sp. J223 TaxID=2898431 RepID=UPI0021AD8328|nr:tripartite tricarboxylate transporter substrate binding protein [Aquabacterium sp. J223]UUX94481.1 tripartite tricarboxylate transporter substrate binding protein [Aquabacterium sp. J223]
MQRRTLLSLAGAVPLAARSPWALADTYPSRPVRLVVPAAGGSGDLFARAIAQRLEQLMGQTFLVEQKPGAGTNIGNAFVAKAAPDGYTLLINGLPLATNPALYDNLTYSPTRDLAPIIQVADIANVVTVHPGLAIQSMKELVQAAKAEPRKFNYGTPGIGSSGHLSAELLAVKTGALLTHVPYQGNAQATNDHLSGVLQVGFVNMPVALQFVRSNRLRALAVTSARRSALLPDVPTVAEALGIPDYELSGWFGIFAPARTPPDILGRLERELAKLLADPAMMEVIRGAGGEPVGGTAAQLEARVRRDAERLTEVIRVSGAKAQ